MQVILSHSKTRRQPGPAWGAPVARERWIGGWEAAALARRLLVLSSGCCEGVVVVGRASFQRGRGVRARVGGARWAQQAMGQRADCLLTQLNLSSNSLRTPLTLDFVCQCISF